MFQNAGVLSHARHLLRAANTRAKTYYQLAYVEEDMLAEEEEKKLDDVEEVKEKTTGKTTAAESIINGKDEGRRRNLVNLLLKQENITDI